MKVLYLVESPVPYGANKSLMDLIDQLTEREITAYVVGSQHGALAEWLEDRGINYYAIGHGLSIYPQRGSLPKRLLFAPSLAAIRALNFLAFVRLVHLCRRLSPDVIHTNIGPSTLGYWTSRVLGIKHVWHLREYQDLDFGLRIFPSKHRFLSLLRRSDRVICITKDVARHFGNPEPPRIISDGVARAEDGHFDPDKSSYFLFVGRLEPTKGIDSVLRAYRDYCEEYDTTCTLAVAGDGNPRYVEKLKLETKRNGTSDKVKFLGFREDVPQLMRKAKCLIVASRNEGFGRITAEAMYNGCMVIGRNTGGTAEILHPGSGDRIGLLFDDDRSIADCMGAVAAMPADEYEAIVRRAQCKAAEHYCIERHAEAVYSVYEEALECP